MKSEAWILTPRELQTIRTYVQHKYASTPDRQPEVFADAIRQVLLRQMPELGWALRQSVAANLIRTRVLGSGRTVRTEDIWRACLDELPHPEPAELQALLHWAQKHVQGTLTEEQLRALIASASDHSWAAVVSAAGASSTTAEAQRSVWAGTGAGWLSRWPKLTYGLLSLLVVAGAALYSQAWIPAAPAAPVLPDVLKLRAPLVYSYQPPLPDGVVNELPPDLRYSKVDETSLRDYLERRGSLLTDEPYYGTLMETAWRYDIHPLLLFAITGQEQGFVPRDQPDAARIANNPFNVYHSWQIYNTTIADSADIAARTVLRWARERPPEIDALTWVNRKYAEDPKWAAGVRRLFDTMRGYGKP
ncbi:glucosaminidase domain-containing protein [Paenibacillus daejeonensis]|uniref:glucosaminidase domain-containing protein n=1 Tax=Paenibacillus daejeonensis TaxID=135193 RepID=UPI00146EFDCC|nr:glucosaminidase domain-containing protein [Paenibacillus daejeonensis]